MPTIPEALATAQQALQTGDRSQARYIYQQILQTAPGEPNALYGLGRLELEAGQLDAAAEHFRRALLACPTAATIHNDLHLVYRRQGRTADAIACCRAALEYEPNSPELHNNLGVVLKETDALDAAVASFERAIALKPSYADAHYNLANALVKLHRLDDAEREYRRAIELAPADFEPHNNLGTLLQLQGRYSQATTAYEAALQCRPDAAEAHRNRALLRLLLGEYRLGWPEYEWRFRLPGARQPSFTAPRWQGEPLDGRTVLLWAEQGLGDTIQFVRFAPLVKARGARVLLQCAPGLHPLLKTAPGIDQLISEDTRAACDYQIPLLSLPVVLGTELATVPASPAYLSAEPERVAHWRGELAAYKKFKVGIAWQGNPNFPGDYYRSLPLEQFAPLDACANVQLFSLQKGPGQEQVVDQASRMSIVDFGAALDTTGGAFVDTAALMMSLDLVIASDTAIAHLAGALGVPVWVALPYAPNWRWLLERRDSPWYPSMRLFRQTRFADWTDVFQLIAAELASLSSETRLS